MVNSTETASDIDRRAAWIRLIACLLIGTLGGVGMWAVAVVLPVIEKEFGVDRGTVSLTYTALMCGIACGGIMYGRMTDRYGVVPVVVCGGIALGLGFILTSQATSLWSYALLQAFIIGMFGTAATFSPLVADISGWFQKRRGIAVALVAGGNYVSGAILPPLIEAAVARYGWRPTYVAVGCIVTAAILPLALVLRRPPPKRTAADVAAANTSVSERPLGLSLNTLTALLVVAGLACCVGMSMPQVHMVAYCGDLGYGFARGAEMLSLMLGLGMVSRLVSGMLSDRLGGLATLLIGSTLQCIVLALYIPVSSLGALYLTAALFGLAQGGIVPSYAMILREFTKPEGIATRIAIVLNATVLGMALGGWLTGAIRAYAGSYTPAFIHAIAWNLLNIGIALFLFQRRFGRDLASARAA